MSYTLPPTYTLTLYTFNQYAIDIDISPTPYLTNNEKRKRTNSLKPQCLSHFTFERNNFFMYDFICCVYIYDRDSERDIKTNLIYFLHSHRTLHGESLCERNQT